MFRIFGGYFDARMSSAADRAGGVAILLTKRSDIYIFPVGRRRARQGGICWRSFISSCINTTECLGVLSEILHNHPRKGIRNWRVNLALPLLSLFVLPCGGDSENFFWFVRVSCFVWSSLHIVWIWTRFEYKTKTVQSGAFIEAFKYARPVIRFVLFGLFDVEEATKLEILQRLGGVRLCGCKPQHHIARSFSLSLAVCRGKGRRSCLVVDVSVWRARDCLKMSAREDLAEVGVRLLLGSV
ncbi:hypothetical protein MPH_00656 [Macrophomina phaseolina MS6]|uniref:Uncharacterized protein n=1 Tax=Macrophomina phaseolina (strain MS6) TaxID=1126212 RepID=K2SZK6_MACPH|nr:hypothetical protein MPH_00656 [Macrophomina phaseolina MS6]